MMHRRGIALLIALVFVLSLSAIMVQSLKRVDRMIEESHSQTDLLQLKSLIEDTRNSLQIAVKRYTLDTQGDVDDLIEGTNSMPPLLFDDRSITITLSDADTTKMDINDVVDTNNTDWVKVFHNLALNSGVSDSYMFINMVKAHRQEFGEITQDRLLDGIMEEYQEQIGDSEIVAMKEYVSTVDTGLSREKISAELSDAIQAVRETRAALTNEEAILQETILKLRCHIVYKRGTFHATATFIFDTQKGEISQLDISF